MPEHIRAFIVVIFIATIMLMVVKPAFVNIVSSRDFNRRAKLWFIITIILFLSHNFWLFIIGSAVAIKLAKRREANYVALYFMLLFVAPPVSLDISGMGVINFLFNLSYIRLLELTLLLPVAILLFSQKDTLAFGKTTPDKLLATYILLSIVLYLRSTTLTDTLRFSFYAFIDVILPYYVISRYLRNRNQFHEAIVALVVAGLILSAIGIFEYLRHWLLYSSLMGALDSNISMSNYLARGGSLRALGTTGQPIALGFVLMVVIGFYLYIQSFIRGKAAIRLVILATLIGGLFASLSRGPWVGMIVFIVVFYMLGPNALGKMSKLTIGGVVVALLVLVLPGGEKLINLLPFIGNVQAENISYRENLFEIGLVVIQQHLWFGSVDFLEASEMQPLIQGQGIIDIVNSYLGIALSYGLVGLGLFVSFFIAILLGVFRALYMIEASHDNESLLGVTLIALLVAILVTIFTVSSIAVIPVVYWAVAGMAVAYIQMVNQKKGRASLEEIS